MGSQLQEGIERFCLTPQTADSYIHPRPLFLKFKIQSWADDSQFASLTLSAKTIACDAMLLIFLIFLAHVITVCSSK